MQSTQNQQPEEENPFSDPQEQLYQVDMPQMHKLFGEPALQLFIYAELRQNIYYRQLESERVAERLSANWDCHVTSNMVEKSRKRMSAYKIPATGLRKYHVEKQQSEDAPRDIAKTSSDMKYRQQENNVRDASASKPPPKKGLMRAIAGEANWNRVQPVRKIPEQISKQGAQNDLFSQPKQNLYQQHLQESTSLLMNRKEHPQRKKQPFQYKRDTGEQERNNEPVDQDFKKPADKEKPSIEDQKKQKSNEQEKKQRNIDRIKLEQSVLEKIKKQVSMELEMNKNIKNTNQQDKSQVDGISQDTSNPRNPTTETNKSKVSSQAAEKLDVDNDDPDESITRVGKNSFKIEDIDEYIGDIKNIKFDSVNEVRSKLVKTMTMFHFQNIPDEKLKQSKTQDGQMYYINPGKELLTVRCKCGKEENKNEQCKFLLNFTISRNQDKQKKIKSIQLAKTGHNMLHNLKIHELR